MQLTLAEIKQITNGAVRIYRENDTICFSRFTKEEQEVYHYPDHSYHSMVFAPAGITLTFETDSENLFLKLYTEALNNRTFFSCDVFVDGIFLDSIDNFSGISPEKITANKLPGSLCEYPVTGYSTVPFPLGEYAKNFLLGAGKKLVSIYLPHSVAAKIQDIQLDDKAFIKPVKYAKKLYAFGDSITQGYDALRPSNRHIAKLAQALQAEEYNKGIAGDIFTPALAQAGDTAEPDYITIAYGSNDWNKVTKGEFTKNARDFCCALRQNYPHSKIFILSPIWRKDWKDSTDFGAFEELGEILREVTADLDMIYIDGFAFIPQDESYYADGLHPNDAGFEQYFQSLHHAITNHIQL